MKNTPPVLRWACIVAAVVILAMFVSDIWLEIDYRVDANLALIVMAGVETAFTWLYNVRSNWRGNRIGRLFMAKSIALSAVLIQAAVSSWWPGTDYPFRQQIRFVIYTVGALAYVAMTITLWLEQQNDRRNPEVTRPPFPF